MSQVAALVWEVEQSTEERSREDEPLPVLRAVFPVSTREKERDRDGKWDEDTSGNCYDSLRVRRRGIIGTAHAFTSYLMDFQARLKHPTPLDSFDPVRSKSQRTAMARIRERSDPKLV